MNNQELLIICNEYLSYDPETGIIIWKKKISQKVVIGKEAGNAMGNYREIRIKGKKYGTHRIAFLMTYGYMPFEIDHKNNIGSDNRIVNLRECTKSENQRNKGMRTDNKSGYKGVSWCKAREKWVAHIHINSKAKNLGGFLCKIEAAKAYDEAAKELHISFANLNFPLA